MRLKIKIAIIASIILIVFWNSLFYRVVPREVAAWMVRRNMEDFLLETGEDPADLGALDWIPGEQALWGFKAVYNGKNKKIIGAWILRNGEIELFIEPIEKNEPNGGKKKGM